MAKNFVDPDWQEAATDNARKGYPWALWGSRDGGPLMLHGSFKTEQEAHQCAARQEILLRPKGAFTLIVVREPV